MCVGVCVMSLASRYCGNYSYGFDALFFGNVVFSCFCGLAYLAFQNKTVGTAEARVDRYLTLVGILNLHLIHV